MVADRKGPVGAVGGSAATPPRIRIRAGGGSGPVPPLAGALAAWVMRAGGDVAVVDPRGAREWEPPDGWEAWPLWVHLEGGAEPPSDGDVWFGPGVDGLEDAGVDGGAGGGRVVRGDPEAGLRPGSGAPAGLADLAALPLTTFAGFGDAQGGAFRLLAGRGDRARPVAAVVREIVYLVETRQLGHVLFDDADLSAYGDWCARFAAEVAHLPWRVTWQGRRGGGDWHGASR